MTEIDRAGALLCKCLRFSLVGQCPDDCPQDSEIWASVYVLSVAQKVCAQVYRSAYASEGFSAIDGAIREAFRRSAMRSVSAQVQRNDEFIRVCSALHEIGIRPLVLKGYVCRRLYPDGDLRPSSDEDLLVSRGELERCHELLTSLGYTPTSRDDAGIGYERGYYSPGGILKLELSVMPFDPASNLGRRMNSILREIHSHPIVHREGDVRIYSPGHTEHFLYLILHAFKHFVHSGVGVRQLCDIMIYARAFGNGIDWDRVLSSLEGVSARCWFATVMQICKERLGLDPLTDGIPDAVFHGAGETAELLSDVLSGGIYGTADLQRTHSSSITLSAVENGDKKPQSAILRTLFPSAEVMEKKYVYLRKRPILLPWAYVSRIAGYAVESLRSHRRASESYEIGKRRVELLHKYGIIDRQGRNG